MAKAAVSGIGGGSCGKALTWADDLAKEFAQDVQPPGAIKQAKLAAMWFPHLSIKAGCERVEKECERLGLKRRKYGNQFYIWK